MYKECVLNNMMQREMSKYNKYINSHPSKVPMPFKVFCCRVDIRLPRICRVARRLALQIYPKEFHQNTMHSVISAVFFQTFILSQRNNCGSRNWCNIRKQHQTFVTMSHLTPNDNIVNTNADWLSLSYPQTMLCDTAVVSRNQTFQCLSNSRKL